ncbi:MAG: TIGR04283 family arsenosugar biosynthesis glycosyltransferase [Parvibaculales bacterium]
MISVIIPTLNVGAHLPATLQSLVPASMEGLVSEVIIIDGGSSDDSAEIAEEMGARLIRSKKRGRGVQLALGAKRAKGAWLLFLHADVVLSEKWVEEGRSFLLQSAPFKAGAFRFALEKKTHAARLMQWLVYWRCALFGLSYGDQGLLIHRSHYEGVGGFKPQEIMEDVDMVRRVGKKNLVMLKSPILISDRRYEEDGYLRRSCKNLFCLTLYFCKVPLSTIARIYYS